MIKLPYEFDDEVTLSRRKFLAGAAATIIAVPVTRTIFLPPPGGWVSTRGGFFGFNTLQDVSLDLSATLAHGLHGLRTVTVEFMADEDGKYAWLGEHMNFHNLVEVNGRLMRIDSVEVKHESKTLYGDYDFPVTIGMMGRSRMIARLTEVKGGDIAQSMIGHPTGVILEETVSYDDGHFIRSVGGHEGLSVFNGRKS